MPVQKWSENVVLARLSDEPQFSEDVDAIAAALVSGPRDVVLDFTGVCTMNSTNISALLKLRKRVADIERRLFICCVGTQVWGVFLVTGLDKVFEFSNNVSTALATLQIAQR